MKMGSHLTESNDCHYYMSRRQLNCPVSFSEDIFLINLYLNKGANCSTYWFLSAYMNRAKEHCHQNIYRQGLKGLSKIGVFKMTYGVHFENCFATNSYLNYKNVNLSIF